jgi:hypothetical protein
MSRGMQTFNKTSEEFQLATSMPTRDSYKDGFTIAS